MFVATYDPPYGGAFIAGETGVGRAHPGGDGQGQAMESGSGAGADMRSIIFDLDGTLADTSADLVAAANAVFARAGHGVQLDPLKDRATAYGGGRAMLRLGYQRLGMPADAALIDAGYDTLLEAYEARIDAQTRLYPGVVQALDRLGADGYALGVCTNKPTPLAELLLQRLGVRDRFAALVGAGCVPMRKPDPEPYMETIRRMNRGSRGSMLIGDTVTDRDTARAVGVPVALVGFGPLGADVAQLAPDAVLDHYDGLDAIAARLLSGAQPSG